MLEILHEDNHIIVAVKPQNIPVMADASGDGDMLGMVKDYLKVKYNKPGNVYAGLVHRLDRPTGGVMVFAKTSKAAARLSEAIRGGEENGDFDTFDKRYYAVVVGAPREKNGTLINYLWKDEKTNNVSIVPQTTGGAKYAELRYSVIEAVGPLSLTECVLVTGRSHQIRVQLKSIGCPVFGDIRYGGDSLAGGHNLALWSYSLSFRHPVTKTMMVFRSLPPVTETPWKNFKMLEPHFNQLIINN